MSYHILQQFDEQVLADVLHEEQEPGEKGRGAGWTSRRPREEDLSGPDFWRKSLWLIVIASLLMAAFALSMALDARRRADDLQKRYTELESLKR
jgi:hypothetical protein